MCLCQENRTHTRQFNKGKEHAELVTKVLEKLKSQMGNSGPTQMSHSWKLLLE